MTPRSPRRAAPPLAVGGAAVLLAACAATPHGSAASATSTIPTTTATTSTVAATGTVPATSATSTIAVSTVATSTVAVTTATSATGTSQPPFTSTSPVTCAASHQNDRVVMVSAVEGAGAGAYAVVSATTFVCGPDIPDDGYYRSVGTPYKLPFTSGARIVLVNQTNGITTRQATLADLEQLVRAHGSPGGWGWYDGVFGVNLTSQGDIREIDEYYHP